MVGSRDIERALAADLVLGLKTKQQQLGYRTGEFAAFLGVKQSLLQKTLLQGKRLGPTVASSALRFPDLQNLAVRFLQVYRERTESVAVQTAPAVRTSSEELQTVT